METILTRPLMYQERIVNYIHVMLGHSSLNSNNWSAIMLQSTLKTLLFIRKVDTFMALEQPESQVRKDHKINILIT